MNQNDKRVVRSRKMLTDAFLELINEKRYQEITVKDIAERAAVGHRTFYRHFENISDLMLYLVTNHYETLLSRMIPFTQESANFTNGQILFEYVLENPVFFKVFFQDRVSDELMPLVLENAIQSEGVKEFREKDPMLLNLIVYQVVSAVFSMIRWWLDNEMPYSTRQMGQFYADTIINSSLRILKSNLDDGGSG